VSIQFDLTAGRTEDHGKRIGKLLRSLGALTAQKKTWSSLTMLGVLWRIAANPRRHRTVLNMRWNSVYSEHLERDPRFLFKYLTHDYMARSMSVQARAACFVHHYRRLYTELPDGMLRRVLLDEVPLLEMPDAGCWFSITMGLSKPWDKEGELSLNMRVNGQLAYVLSFSVVPGWVVGSMAPEVMLIGRLQGERGGKQLIAMASKSMCDVAPAAALLAALEGVGEALGVYAVASVRAEDQTSYREFFRENFLSAYDNFFAALAVPLNEKGFFLTSIPVPEKPMSAIKRGHKIRTKAKREFKRRIAAEVCIMLRAYRRVRLLAFPPAESPANLSWGTRYVLGDG
jgi:uncharacterized protein VirK/YbjX